MRWLELVRQHAPQDSRSEEPRESGPAPVERASPGLAALFENLHDDGRHSFLDLGLAGNDHLRVFGRFARQIRFAGLVPGPPTGEALTSAFEELPPNPDRPYDVVFAWDIFDRIEPDDHPAVIERLAELTAPGARLYAVVESSGAATTRPVRSTLVDIDRVVHEVVGPTEPKRPHLLPGHMERLLAPFEVMNAFSLRIGLREYVAVKR